jgi:carbon-monoxide dehydrogenase small subunit
MTVNGENVVVDLPPNILLVNLIRDTLNLTGTKIGCETSVCGACTVMVDDEPVKSCTIFAVQVADRSVTTIEGLSADGLTAVQRGLNAEHGLQCGYCTPGMVVSATALLRETNTPTDAEIKEAFKGNLCRCTGYTGIIRGIHHAAALLRGESPPSSAGVAIETPKVTIEVAKTEILATDVEVV